MVPFPEPVDVEKRLGPAAACRARRQRAPACRGPGQRCAGLHQGPHGRSGRHGEGLMLGWILGFLWLAVLKAWLGSHVALDADALGVADLWNSLHSGGHLGDWIMGPHPYVFPDLAIYGVGAYFAPDIVGRQICFGLIQGFLLWWFLARLMKRIVRLDGSAARAYAAAGLLVLLPCLNAANGLGGALVPGYHGGVLLCALAFLSWCVGQDRALSSWPAVLWAACLVGLVWASDQITPVWVILPGMLLSLGL